MVKFICFLVFIFPYSLFSQSKEDTKSALLQHIKNMNNKPKITKGKYQYTEMEIETKNVDNSVESVQIKSTVGKEIFIYDSNLNSIYQDLTSTFTIIHAKKVIFERKNASDVSKNWEVQQGGALSKMREQLIETGNIKEIKDTLWNGIKIKRIEMEISEDMKKNVNFSKMVYFFCVEEDKMYAQTMFYKKGHNILYQKVIYNQLDYDYKGKVLSFAKMHIVDDKNQLLPKFKDYTLQKI